MRYNESYIQQSCVTWFRYQFPYYSKLLIAIPNAGRRTTKLVTTRTGSKVVCVGGKRAKDEGMVAGVADIILLVLIGNYGCLCLEFKTEKGRQSPEQKEWQEATEKAGNKYCVIRSFEEFKTEIETYLNIK